MSRSTCERVLGARGSVVETEGGRWIRVLQRRKLCPRRSCGGVEKQTVIYYQVDQLIESFIVTTSSDNAYETTLYVRRGCTDPASEVACSREPVGDGVAANRLQINEPPLGGYYIFMDGVSATAADFAVQIETVPLAQCINGLDDDEDGRTDYPVDPGCLDRSDRDETDPDTPPSALMGSIMMPMDLWIIRILVAGRRVEPMKPIMWPGGVHRLSSW